MRFKQTPAVVASLVYGIALVLSFLVFLLIGSPEKAFLFAQYVAALLLMPTWVLLLVAGLLTKKRGKNQRFAIQAGAITAIALAVGAFINSAKADFAASGKVDAKALATFVSTFTTLDATYVVTALVALSITYFVIFRKPELQTTVGSDYGVPPREAASKAKPTRPAPPQKPKRNK
ncbi:MAG: hypothetical protein ACKOWK_00765 [Micrococcales bacterium]